MKEISFKNDILPLKNELYRLALRITLSEMEAEDVVQDTLIKVWNSRESWPGIDSIEAYSMAICRNKALDRLRLKDNQLASLEQQNSGEMVADSNPQQKLIAKDRLEAVRALIDALPEKQRSCMQLRDIEGKSYKEVANILGISEEQVKVSIFRARQTIRKQFQELEEYGL